MTDRVRTTGRVRATESGVPITAAVFDLGGVLIDWDPRHLYRRLFAGDEAAMERFLSEVCTPEWNARQDAGRPWDEAVAELASRHPESRDLIVAFDRRWEEMLGGPIRGTVDVLGELRGAGLPIYALSNWSAAKFPIARLHFAFLSWFDDIVISGELGTIKPDPAMFRALLDRHGLEPSTTVYVDDSPANVAVAAALGMVALRFADPATLRHDLVRLGLPVAARPA